MSPADQRLVSISKLLVDAFGKIEIVHFFEQFVGFSKVTVCNLLVINLWCR